MAKKVLTFSILVLAAITASLYYIGLNKKTEVDFNFNLVNLNSLQFNLDGKAIKVQKPLDQYFLKSGSHDVEVTDSGYKNFSTKFDVQRGHKLLININMQPDSSTLSTAEQEARTQLGTSINNMTIASSQFFDDSTWVFVTTTDSTGNSSYSILNYTADLKAWTIVDGPGTIFFNSDLKGLPKDLADFMNQQGYVIKQ